jgi:hypothetical protein
MGDLKIKNDRKIMVLAILILFSSGTLADAKSATQIERTAYVNNASLLAYQSLAGNRPDCFSRKIFNKVTEMLKHYKPDMIFPSAN